MSIAASVAIRPSRLLRLLVALPGICIVGISIRLALFEFAALAAPSRFSASLLVALAGCALIYSAFGARKSFQLDISGVGEIRLREHYTSAIAQGGKSSRNAQIAYEAVQLMDDSTIWPTLLVLRLRRADGSRTGLIVLPDMVETDAFRALVVAMQWVAAQNADGRTGQPKGNRPLH